MSPLLCVSLLCACRERPAPPPLPEAKTEWPTPAPDPSPHCEDVGELRVCWVVPGVPDGIAVTPRPLPPFRSSGLGFRCTGRGAARTCADRTLFTEEFRCDGARCEQRHPRLPDDGEWECADVAGAVFCRGGERAAGVPPGTVDPAFVCNARVVRGEKRPERLCVDWSPDFPEGRAEGFRCHFEPEGGTTRVCSREASVHGVGDPCDAARPCIAGLRCTVGRCVPPRPEPSCWVDADCGEGACRFGVCTARSP